MVRARHPPPRLTELVRPRHHVERDATLLPGGRVREPSLPSFPQAPPSSSQLRSPPSSLPQLDELDLKSSSIKAVLASQNLPPKESSRLLALVIETLKFKPTIIALLDKIPLTKDDKKILGAKSKNLSLVLVQDLLFAKKTG